MTGAERMRRSREKKKRELAEAMEEIDRKEQRAKARGRPTPIDKRIRGAYLDLTAAPDWLFDEWLASLTVKERENMADLLGEIQKTTERWRVALEARPTLRPVD